MTAVPREGSFEVVSFNVSTKTGTRKRPVDRVSFVEGLGMEGDAHAGLIENRQVSLLAVEEIEEASRKLEESLARPEARGLGTVEDGFSGGLASPSRPEAAIIMPEGATLVRGKAGLDHLSPGDFAENITTRGIVLHELPLGTRLKIGSVVLEVSKIGKECHTACEIRRLVGDCVMPRKGIFARVVTGGEARREDSCRYRI
ncbi:MAG TPA: MOSC domain-containing protein [Rectinemataceae bacterium]|nr:MOSC domain-containing protein [Rectinemataceae bacterium]